MTTITNIEDFFDAVKPTGEGWKANCPKCDDRDMKFSWNTEKGVGCCHHSGCSWYEHAGGVTEYRLRAFFGDQPVLRSYPAKVIQSEEADVNLPEGFEILEEDHIVTAYLRSRGLMWKSIKQAKVGYCEKGKMWGYIIFPVFDNGEVVYWQGRRFKDRDRKFWNPESSRKSELIYDVPSESRPKSIVLVESVINALTLTNGHLTNTKVIATLGKKLSQTQISKILAYERYALDLVIALDPDAWREATDLAKTLCSALPVKLAEFPAGEDVNSVGREEAWKRIYRAEAYRRERHLEILQKGLRHAKAS